MLMATIPKGELTDALLAFRRVFVMVGIFSCAINLLLLTPALYMLQVYDRVLTSRNEDTLVLLTLLLLGLLMLEGAIEFIRSRVMARVSAALDLGMSSRVFNSMFQQTLQGAEVARVPSDLAAVRQLLTGKGLLALFDAPWVPIYIWVTSLLNPWLGLFALVAAILLLVLAWFNERVTADLYAESGRLGLLASQYASASLRNSEVIHAMGMLPAMRRRWETKQSNQLAVLGEVNDRAAKISGTVRFLRQFFQSGALAGGAYLVLQGQLTAGGMIAASILLGRALAPVDAAIGSWRSVVRAREALAYLNALLRDHPESSQLVRLPKPKGTISMEAAVVASPRVREPILKGLTFQIGAGRVVAIIGPSASGKSTLARALVGVWQPVSGTVRLDGADIARWDRDQLGSCIGYLPQDIELFEGGIAENIARFGELDSDQIVAAARRAGVHELILKLPAGYETTIGEGGVMLSGGQRQRIALARAVYGTPAVVILDEPNANLDEAGDAALVSAIRALKASGSTVVIVTHRMNLLTETDSIMVLNEGRIQAFGASSEILKPSRPKISSVEHGMTKQVSGGAS